MWLKLRKFKFLSIDFNVSWVLKIHRLIETILLSTHNMCFGLEIRKLIFNYTLLFRGQTSLILTGPAKIHLKMLSAHSVCSSCLLHSFANIINFDLC